MIFRYDRDQRTGPTILASSESRPSSTGLVGRLSVFLSWFGALVSIALMAGIGYWAANLGSRDILEIPVIRAMEGHARTRPIDPGGLQVGNQGLSINQVIESGIAAEASDTVVLAPRPMPLDSRDTVASNDILIDETYSQETLIAGEAEPTASTGTVRPIEQANVAEAMETPDEAEVEPVLETADSATLPRPRPNGLGVAPLERDALVVHLGSFGSYQVAEEERKRLITDHGDLIGDRPTVIQSTESSGVMSYSIAAVGFESQVASRNLCTRCLSVESSASRLRIADVGPGLHLRMRRTAAYVLGAAVLCGRRPVGIHPFCPQHR